MISIRPATVSEIISCPDLLAEYAEETRVDSLPEPIAKLDLYQKLQESGLYHIIAAYKEEELIGFISLMVNLFPHYSRIGAVTESFFVSIKHRKTGVGLRLLRYAEKLAKEKGAMCIMVSAPYGGKLEKVMPKAGYRHSNTVFMRLL